MMNIDILLLFTPLLLTGIAVLYNFELTQRLHVNGLAASTVLLMVLLYLPSLLAGMSGMYTAHVVYSISAGISLTVLLLLRRLLAKLNKIDKPHTQMSINKESSLILFIGLVLMSPVFTLLYNLPKDIFRNDIWLPWDAVSYHLPALVEYIQAESFWSQNGPYQSYSFAYEATMNFITLLFPSHLGFVIGNTIGVMFFCISVYYLVEVVDKQTNCITKINRLAIFALIIGVWCLLFKNKLVAIGKNDIFQTACIFMTLASLIDYMGTLREQRYRRIYLFILSICSAGLALGTKPTSLAYVPFFMLLVYTSEWDSSKRTITNLTKLSPLRSTLLFVIGLYLIGGFFLTRNYIIYGTINPLPSAFQLSLLANLQNSALYQFQLGGVVFLCSVISVLFWIIPIVFSKNRKAKLVFTVLLLFHVCTVCTFMVTPHAVFHHTTQWATWKLRLGLPLFTTMVVVCMLVFCLAAEKLYTYRRLCSSVLVVAICFALVAASSLPYTRHLSGLPHYEVIKKYPKTNAYRWLQQQDHEYRIYSAGLRPYGLVGNEWQNVIFYDLHSTVLEPMDTGIDRVKSILHAFKPDLIAISVDPHPYSGNSMPDVTQWMKNNPECFTLEFEDEAVMIFRVKKDAVQRLDPSGKFRSRKLRMHG